MRYLAIVAAVLLGAHLAALIANDRPTAPEPLRAVACERNGHNAMLYGRAVPSYECRIVEASR